LKEREKQKQRLDFEINESVRFRFFDFERLILVLENIYHSNNNDDEFQTKYGKSLLRIIEKIYRIMHNFIQDDDLSVREYGIILEYVNGCLSKDIKIFDCSLLGWLKLKLDRLFHTLYKEFDYIITDE
jgi:hypothetical protein